MSASSHLEIRQDSEGGSLLAVRAQPGASRDRIVGLHGRALKIAVTAPPEKGRANAAIVRVLARALRVARGSVTVHSGGTSRDKWIRVDELEPRELREKLLERLGD